MRFYKWTVEFEVADVWVADGFDLDNDRAQEMLEQHIGWAYSHELRAKVIKAPSPARIRKEQGYTDTVVEEGA